MCSRKVRVSLSGLVNAIAENCCTLNYAKGSLPLNPLSLQEKSTIAAIQSESGTHSTSGYGAQPR